MEETQQYIGYRKTAPPELARFMRKNIIKLLIFAVAMAFILVISQQAFGPGFFEFRKYREFEGVIHETPYPTLQVLRPGRGQTAASFSRYYLVSPGKWGAQELVRGLDGRFVKLKGSLVFREDQTMIELVPGSLSPEGSESSGTRPGAAASGQSLGVQRLKGEIVDSKCYLGVMNPGNLKPHQSCAIRCISGGIPPVFLVRDQRGNAIYLMLVSAEGKAVNQQVLDRVAEPLEIEGEVIRYDNLYVLKADPAAYRRLN